MNDEQMFRPRSIEGVYQPKRTTPDKATHDLVHDALLKRGFYFVAEEYEVEVGIPQKFASCRYITVVTILGSTDNGYFVMNGRQQFTDENIQHSCRVQYYERLEEENGEPNWQPVGIGN